MGFLFQNKQKQGRRTARSIVHPHYEIQGKLYLIHRKLLEHYD